MSSAAYVADARQWAGVLIAREHRGPGDTVDAAMRRAERRYGVDYNTLWKMRYRPPKDIAVTLYFRLKDAFDLECARQEARLAHELKLAREAGLDEANSPVVAEAEAFLGSAKVRGGGR